ADHHGLAETATHLDSYLEIADERFRTHEEFVGENVPGTYEEPTTLNETAQVGLPLGPDRQVVLQHNRLSVEHKVFVAWGMIQQRQNLVDQVNELESKLLKSLVPLTVPVGVGDHKNRRRCRPGGKRGHDIHPY